MKARTIIMLVFAFVWALCSCGNKSGNNAADKADSTAMAADTTAAVTNQPTTDTVAANSQSEAAAEDDGEDVADEEEDDGGIKPPFTFTTELKRVPEIGCRYTYKVKILKGGDAMVYEDTYWRGSDGKYAVHDDATWKEATWEITYTGRGEDYQRVYKINYNSQVWYAPDDMKYLWTNEDAYFQMRDHDTNKAIKIESVKQLSK